MRIEEIKMNEDRKLELQAKKKLKEMRDKRRFGLGKEVFEFFSYDANGKAIEFQKDQELPSLAAKCKQVATIPIINEEEKKKTDKQPKASSKSIRKVLFANVKYFKANEEKDIDDSIPRNIKGLYDSLLPSLGVTFTEKGKKPKANILINSEPTPKISNSIVMENSFLPDISSSKLIN